MKGLYWVTVSQRVWAFMHAGLWVNTSYLGMWKKNLKKIWRIAPSGIDGYDATWVELMAVICTKWRWADRKKCSVDVMIIRWEHTHTHTECCWHRQAQGMHDSASAAVQSVCNGDMLNVQLDLPFLFWRIFQKKDEDSVNRVGELWRHSVGGSSVSMTLVPSTKSQ